MKKNLTSLLFLFIFAHGLQAQTASGTIMIYGKVIRNSLPASRTKVFLVEATYTGMSLDKTICNQKKYPPQVKTFSTDSKGEYNFKGVKKSIKYKLVICDPGMTKVYVFELKIPASASSILKVSDKKIQ